MNQKTYYVTTPIYYINDVPHIGHAYSTIAADVLARYYRTKLGKDNVFFLTGTDENSKKTLEAAKLANLEVQQYTDKTAKKWQAIWDKLDISYNRFIRTTEPAHINAVSDIITKIYEKGDVYKGEYEGWYCFKCEAFYKDEDLKAKKCPIHKSEVEFIKEDNYFFKLSKYQDKLIELIKNNPEFIKPQSRKNEVLAFIERGLEDISISRASQSWGVKLPFDESQVVYVWFDALINYLTGVNYPDKSYKKFWPANIQIIGKDIIKFHCIIWPAMLLSAGIDLPQQIFAHGFFTIDGEKISKSFGNAIDPIELSKEYSNDALRYFLLREITFGSDGDFSHSRFASTYNADLANNLGNLVSRVAAMLTKYNNGVINNVEAKNLLDISQDLEKLEFHNCLSKLFSSFDNLNEELEKQKPWEIAKTDKLKASNILSEIALLLVQRSEQLAPFLPETAQKIQETFANSKVNNKVGILFPKIEDKR